MGEITNEMLYELVKEIQGDVVGIKHDLERLEGTGYYQSEILAEIEAEEAAKKADRKEGAVPPDSVE